MESTEINKVRHLNVLLERDVFLRTLIRHLAGTLEEVVGLKDAAGFVSVVGQKMGEEINSAYRQALQVDNLSREQVAAVLEDLKRRIQGDFYLIEMNDARIVFGNRQCPFEDKVIGRRSMCMMTSNVFGGITAENLGYGRVELEQTIAAGDKECKVIVHLKPTDGDVKDAREYFKSE